MGILRCICGVLLLTLLAGAPLQARTVRNSKTVRKEQREAARRLEQTRGKIKMNEGEIRRGIARYESLGAEIAGADARIASLSHTVDSVSARAKNMADSVEATQARVDLLKESYAESLRSIRDRKSTRLNSSHLA